MTQALMAPPAMIRKNSNEKAIPLFVMNWNSNSIRPSEATSLAWAFAFALVARVVPAVVLVWRSPAATPEPEPEPEPAKPASLPDNSLRCKPVLELDGAPDPDPNPGSAK